MLKWLGLLTAAAIGFVATTAGKDASAGAALSGLTGTIEALARLMTPERLEGLAAAMPIGGAFLVPVAVLLIIMLGVSLSRVLRLTLTLAGAALLVLGLVYLIQMRPDLAQRLASFLPA